MKVHPELLLLLLACRLSAASNEINIAGSLFQPTDISQDLTLNWTNHPRFSSSDGSVYHIAETAAEDKITERLEQVQGHQDDPLFNRTLVVVTILGSAPYCMRKASSDEFEGYAIDLIDEISNILGFNYTFIMEPDGRYGIMNPETKEWDGLVRMLQDEKADLGIADLTVNYEREQAVDFTMPFMNLGISILYRKPTKQPPNLFSFLSPLSPDVWICIALAVIGISTLLFFLARFTPYENEIADPQAAPSADTENQFNLVNSLWFSATCLMQQGCDFLPKAISTRMVAGMWWFFALIMISSYTANLVAFLSVESLSSPIKSVEDLSKQTKIKYGSQSGGSTASFFMNANSSMYKSMWSFMTSSKPSVFTTSNSEGVQKIIQAKGGYAFLMESASLEFIVERNCELTQVGGLLDSKGYGIATPKNSPYRAAISGAILKLQEEGKLHILKTRWWKEKLGGGSCFDDSSGSSAANELGLANVGGVFVVLLGGMGVACVIAVGEFLWTSRKNPSSGKKSSLCAEIVHGLSHALQCRGSSHQARKRRLKPRGSNVAPGNGTEAPHFIPLSPYTFVMSRHDNVKRFQQVEHFYYD